MSDEFDEEDSNDFTSIDLKYVLYSDEEHGTVYVKFEGFENKYQIDTFIEFMDMSIPLLMHQSETKH